MQPATIIRDHAGRRWRLADSQVAEVLGRQLTLCRGWKAERKIVRGPPSWIVTAELADFYRSLAGPHMLVDVLIDAGLPLFPERIYEHRRQLGLHRMADTDQWWSDRADDLQSLSLAEFAEKHGVHKASAARRRVRLGITRLAKRKRPVGWWKKPEVAAEFKSREPAELAIRYGLTVARISQIRAQMRDEGLLK
jgi:hypothetical protein